MTQLTDVLRWNRRFGFDETETMNALDELAADGIISLNKQLHPCTIIRMEESENVLGRLYDTLI